MKNILLASDIGALKSLEKFSSEIQKFTQITAIQFKQNDDLENYTQFSDKIKKEQSRGILLSTDSIFASIILNKFSGIRAVIANNYYIASMSRQHNDANIMIVPLDGLSESAGLLLVSPFLLNSLDLSNQNHSRRVEKLENVKNRENSDK